MSPSELPEEEPLVDGEQEEEPLEEPTKPEDKPVEDDDLIWIWIFNLNKGNETC